jgi:hypothetical protein
MTVLSDGLRGAHDPRIAQNAVTLDNIGASETITSTNHEHVFYFLFGSKISFNFATVVGFKS